MSTEKDMESAKRQALDQFESIAEMIKAVRDARRLILPFHLEHTAMNPKIWTRFILADGAGAVYELADPSTGKTARIEIAGDKVIRFYEDGPISRAVAVASLNEFRAKEWARFLEWAPRHSIDLADYPAPPAIIV